LSTNLQI